MQNTIKIEVHIIPIKKIEKIKFRCRVKEDDVVKDEKTKMNLHFNQEDVDRWQKEDIEEPGILACNPDALKNMPSLMDVIKGLRSDRDWSEDFSDENGNYMNKCCVCKEFFFGYKRRVVCKKCKKKTTVPFPQ